MNEKPWQKATLLNRGQCGRFTDFRGLEKRDIVFETRMSSGKEFGCSKKN